MLIHQNVLESWLAKRLAGHRTTHPSNALNTLAKLWSATRCLDDLQATSATGLLATIKYVQRTDRGYALSVLPQATVCPRLIAVLKLSGSSAPSQMPVANGPHDDGEE